jgi:hypothetical protein
MENIISLPSNLTTLSLKGPVKSLELNYYAAHFKSGKIVQGKLQDRNIDKQNFILCFNEKGEKTEEEYLYIGGEESSKNVFNEKGLVVETYYYDKGDLKGTSNCNHNDKGLKTREIYIDAKTKEKSERIFEYDENGKNVLFQQLYPVESNNISEYMSYDDKGHLIEKKNIKADGTIYFWQLYTPDEHGMPIETKTMNPDGSINSTDTKTYIYDNDGKLIGSNGSLYDVDEVFDCVEYEHDDYGNWLTMVEYREKIPVYMCIRTISYFGEKAKTPPTHSSPKSFPYTIENKFEKKAGVPNEKIMDMLQLPLYPDDAQFTESQSEWMEKAADVNLHAQRYYVLRNEKLPFTVAYKERSIEVMALLGELITNLGAKIIFSSERTAAERDEIELVNYILRFPDLNYLLAVGEIYPRNKDNFLVSGFVSYYYDEDKNPSLCTGTLTLLRPGDDDRWYELEDQINAYIDLCELEKKPGKPEIYLVEVKSGGYTLKPHVVNDNSSIKNLDLHYGYGFEQFHNELIRRFQTEKKGLILFHGKPGTGKTYYIRHLLNSMPANKKIVIYMPPNMVDNLVNPGFFTFLTKEIAKYSANGYFCVLLIEDAEPLLAQRVSDVRIQGISNLLNMTDGLLNDILNLQIICTFNVDLKMLDKALLRPGRLLARKEFGPMPPLDANILAGQLGIKHHFTKPATIARVYSFLKNKETLRHGVAEQEDEG